MTKTIRRGLVIFIAAIWEALNQWHLIDFVITKLRSEGPVGMFLADLITSPTFRLLLILAGLIVVVVGYMEDRQRALHTPGGLSPLPASLFPAAPPAVQGRLPKTQQRVFVGKEVTPKYLNKLLEGRTKIQAQALVDIYVGKWMKVSGKLATVSSPSEPSFTMQVTFKTKTLEFNDLYMFFSSKWRDRLAIMTIGQQITVVGKIDEVNAFGVQLKECELVDS
jgi:hypothetical protein